MSIDLANLDALPDNWFELITTLLSLAIGLWGGSKIQKYKFTHNEKNTHNEKHVTKTKRKQDIDQGIEESDGSTNAVVEGNFHDHSSKTFVKEQNVYLAPHASSQEVGTKQKALEENPVAEDQEVIDEHDFIYEKIGKIFQKLNTRCEPFEANFPQAKIYIESGSKRLAVECLQTSFGDHFLSRFPGKETYVEYINQITELVNSMDAENIEATYEQLKDLLFSFIRFSENEH